MLLSSCTLIYLLCFDLMWCITVKYLMFCKQIIVKCDTTDYEWIYEFVCKE